MIPGPSSPMPDNLKRPHPGESDGERAWFLHTTMI